MMISFCFWKMGRFQVLFNLTSQTSSVTPKSFILLMDILKGRSCLSSPKMDLLMLGSNTTQTPSILVNFKWQKTLIFGGKPSCFVLGMNKTHQKMSEFYWMRGMQRWVSEKVRNCVVCSQKKSTSLAKATRAPLIAIPVEPQAFWRVHVDLAGPFNESRNGCNYIGVGICAFLKYIEVEGNVRQKPFFLPICLFLKLVGSCFLRFWILFVYFWSCFFFDFGSVSFQVLKEKMSTM